MSLIIYTKNINNQEYGIKQINKKMFKKLMYNEIHKRCRFSIPKENITKEFAIDFNDESTDDDKMQQYHTNIELDNELDENIILDENNELDNELNVNNELDCANETIPNSNPSNINVLMMTEMNEKQLNTYLEIYQDEQDNLEKFIEFLSIITYNQINPDKFKIKKKINLLLNSLSEYWEDPNNCNYTLTDKFNKRKFNNINYNGFDNNVIKNIINDFESTWDTKEINYLNEIIKFNDWKEMCIQKYYIAQKSQFTCDDIVQIYKQLPTEYMKYLFVSNMLCSRIHCHLILNNREFLEISKPLFTKYKLIFKYLIGYAWINLKNEEYHIYHKITDADRIVFDINTVNLLPIYPFSYDDINQNPYACLLIDKEILNIKNNCLSMNMMRDYEKYYGVCDVKEFERRLNIFVNNGTNIKGVLEYVDWNSCVISGSVMTACGMKRNPLLDIYKTDNNINTIADNDLANYFFHQYNDSDVDLICNKKSIYDFIDVIDAFILKAETNYKNLSVSNIHTSTMILSDNFLLNELESINNVISNEKFQGKQISVEFIKSNLSNPEIIKYFYSKYYIHWKNEQKTNLINMGKNVNDGLIKEYLQPIPENEFKLCTMNYELNTNNYIEQDYEKYFYSKYDSDTSTDKNILAKLSESIRFKISNKNFKTFEIFKSKDTNFFSIISRFHMGFVRALWNGKTVLCLPSYITSMMLQLSVDYKYFSSIRNPILIVNKYRSRGFGIILNGYEKLHMAYYNSSKLKDSDDNSKWIEMYKVNIKSKQSVENIFGVKKSSDDIFKPSKYFMGIPSDCYKNINHDTLSSFDECFSSLITPTLTPLTKLKAINDNGKINPLSRDFINLGFNLLN